MMFFDYIFTLVYFIGEILIFAYKYYNLFYPPYAIDPEVASLFFYFLIQLNRIYLARLGNRTETSGYLVLFFILSMFIIFAYCYNLVLQTYSLAIELLLNGFGLFIIIVEFIFVMLALGGISEHEKNL
jgi:hypothetical protein